MTADISGVVANLVDMGRSTKVQLLSFKYVQAIGPAADALGVGDHESLQRSVRVRSVDGLSFSYLLAYVPERIGVTFNAKDLADHQLLELLVRADYDRNGRGVEHLRALYRPDRYTFEFDLIRSNGARKKSWSAFPLVLRKPKKPKSSTAISFV